MTRINLVPPSELSDAWLISEYRELPRVVKRSISIENAPNKYKLGEGHVKWARKHSLFVISRFDELVKEMYYRGFKPRFCSTLSYYVTKEMFNDYNPTTYDVMVSKNRLIQKYKQNPKAHKWTKREKPDYLQID